jgi:hypothetical protein
MLAWASRHGGGQSRGALLRRCRQDYWLTNERSSSLPMTGTTGPFLIKVFDPVPRHHD